MSSQYWALASASWWELKVTNCSCCDGARPHLALVDGDGPGQFERQLLSTQVDAAARLEHPALGLQQLCDATQETHTRESWGNADRVSVWLLDCTVVYVISVSHHASLPFIHDRPSFLFHLKYPPVMFFMSLEAAVVATTDYWCSTAPL